MEDETEEECLRRELMEELNIEVLVIRRLMPILFSYPDLDLELIPFLAKYHGGDLQLAEHLDARWLRKEELSAIDWAPADLEVLRQINDIQFD